MTWVKIDDQFQDHPKFLDVSLAGIGLWAAGLAYCSRYLTDGYVSASAARRLGGTQRLVGELVAASLWEAVDGGWFVHDYTDYNPPASRVRDTREKRKESGRQGGVARAKQIAKQNGSSAQAKPKHGAKASASPRPVPYREGFSDDGSVVLQGGCGGTDDGPICQETAREAVRQLSLRALDNRRNERPDLPIHRPALWIETDFAERWALHGDTAEPLAEQGLTAEQIAERLEPGPLATVHELPRPVEYPECTHCGKNHDQRSLCWFDPAHPRHAESEPS